MADPARTATLLLSQTMRSLGFLSRLPVPARFFNDDAFAPSMREDAAGFAFAGALIALVPALLLVVLSAISTPPMLAAGFCVLAYIAVTGALHEDGLGDVADGFGGGGSKEQRLEIMKDSRIGTYGAVAIAGSLLLRVAALAAIVTAHGASASGFALIAVAACSRAAIAWFWASLPSARSGGVADTAGAPAENAVGTAAISGLAIFALFATASIGFVNAALALLLALAALQGFTRLCRRMLGGQTGDTLGACQQIVEIMLLTGLALGISIPN